jgi:hypothetical protein
MRKMAKRPSRQRGGAARGTPPAVCKITTFWPKFVRILVNSPMFAQKRKTAPNASRPRGDAGVQNNHIFA